MDKSIRKHRKKIRNKINNLKSTNPKEYWKILNSRRKQHSPDIPINKGRSPSNGELSDFSFYFDSQKSAHRKFKKYIN